MKVCECENDQLRLQTAYQGLGPAKGVILETPLLFNNQICVRYIAIAVSHVRLNNLFGAWMNVGS